MAAEQMPTTLVAVVMPMRNAAPWLSEALESLLTQSYDGPMELTVFNDGSSDDSLRILASWQPRLEARGIKVTRDGHSDAAVTKGPGFGKNRAIRNISSTSEYLCFFDADDVMHRDRIHLQVKAAEVSFKETGEHHLIGCRFTRIPEGSTDRYTRWCNSLTPAQLYTQAFTAFGPTVIQPTWFLHRSVYEAAGPYNETGLGTPEDLLFFYNHLAIGGKVLCVEQPLLVYRHHPQAASQRVNRWTIWDERVKALEKFVLDKWEHFTIWNAGKQGRRLYRSLSPQSRAKVEAFCDVDAKKIARGLYIYEDSVELPKPRVPIVHYSKANPPFVLCVKWDLTDGAFEEILASLKLSEGVDYVNFS